MSIQHRSTTAEIDLAALRHNAGEVFRKIPAGVAVMPIIKADAYGHGAVMCARVLEKCGMREFGLATIEEAVALKEQGINASLTVLGGVMTDHVDVLVGHRLRPVVHQMADIERLGPYLKKKNEELFIHIKIDTGMGRLGFFPAEVDALIAALRRYPQIKVQSVMTHLARADEVPCETTDRQFILFKKLKEIFESKGITDKVYHIANSAAVIAGKVDGTMLVRPGIMLYGVNPQLHRTGEIGLKPVMTLKTHVLAVKKFRKGDALSYGSTFVCPRESLIAILPIGYADGYPRLLSNRGEVLLRGKRAPVVGRVCMDLTLIDVTSVGGIAPGEEVICFGGEGEHLLSVDEVAAWAETIAYEILCGISSRVPRVYTGL